MDRTQDERIAELEAEVQSLMGERQEQIDHNVFLLRVITGLAMRSGVDLYTLEREGTPRRPKIE